MSIKIAVFFNKNVPSRLEITEKYPRTKSKDKVYHVISIIFRHNQNKPFKISKILLLDICYVISSLLGTFLLKITAIFLKPLTNLF